MIYIYRIYMLFIYYILIGIYIYDISVMPLVFSHIAKIYIYMYIYSCIYAFALLEMQLMGPLHTGAISGRGGAGGGGRPPGLLPNCTLQRQADAELSGQGASCNCSLLVYGRCSTGAHHVSWHTVGQVSLSSCAGQSEEGALRSQIRAGAVRWCRRYEVWWGMASGAVRACRRRCGTC